MDRITFRPSLVIVFAMLGFLVAIAFNTARDLGQARPDRVGDLATVARDMETQRDELQQRLSELRHRMNDLEREAAEDAGVRETFSRELREARASAGLSGVVGPGLEVILADGTEVPPGADPNDYVIHDTDLAAVVNALLAGGAEAIDVNGERIVGTTPIRCAGTTILVNSVRIGSPYTVRAIGDPVELEAALAEDHSASLVLVTYKKQFSLQVSVSQSNRLQVAAFKGTLRPQYLQQVGGDPS